MSTFYGIVIVDWKYRTYLIHVIIERSTNIVGPILDDRLKEKFLKPWKGVLCIHFRVCLSVCVSVCLCVCTRATEHTFWPMNLIFGSNDPWDMRKKRIFLFFEIFIFTLFIGIFRFFPYITLFIMYASYKLSNKNKVFLRCLLKHFLYWYDRNPLSFPHFKKPQLEPAHDFNTIICTCYS